ncbi:uncharacterized protein N7487_011371 [Penicillium crustosum]|uniref:uncharacterized protein n=1 Tax=Penicillium crustosum TaxID=36656 RepID=UPI00238A8FB1|nr:uncharacterized protein N7487_011371 [Penicillium crustosum]KAJ5393730.1 hypothetical protein N7487_011371 [Penicillium crustosum]
MSLYYSRILNLPTTNVAIIGRAITLSPNTPVMLEKLDAFTRIQPESYELYDLHSRTAGRIQCRKPLGLWLLRRACLPPRRD